MSQSSSKPPSFTWAEVVWYNVITLAVWHAMALYALLFVLPQASVAEIATLWGGLWFISGLGITAGAHRLWAHRAYKARLPLRVFLMLANSMAFQGSIFEWARDHRVHHKGSDTTADPHNSKRGFFFAHMGWVMVRKHPDVFKEGKKMSYDDLDADVVVAAQKKHYLLSVLLMCYVSPSVLGHLAFGSASTGFWIGGIFRHVWVLHMTWCVNSVAHFFGYKPYDRNIRPVENLLVSIGAIGEGWHNFHHKFPSDYATGEMGILQQWNPTKAFIDLMALVGQAYDLKRSRTSTSTRERVAAAVEAEAAKGIAPPPSTWDQFTSWLFFGRTEDQALF
ncbi:stearoyl-CoA desaturase (delta-9 desaturase) [Saprolegnia diclina VS20]|uniref:Stearoyl-CoA desaturase (Delta-9 desaturase) n=1 Tax=Saprolegnia diclina (strain VS20) TaxID=1156394 RepID=T0PXT9_SAPDV|nr:stearoyl-CoA desaturase (delta-9 desaturase) [Saprolegnia diclina VS20]EQC27056.1 stearoyl-CoA desaturase (delta-9 desaturase) [Saprolegnia diclina VS20]|eukprot:XP_008619556.1 stearoyl-CoA desaturase (delta-9 desaturase) [Saprolegnia diclina VS20]